MAAISMSFWAIFVARPFLPDRGDPGGLPVSPAPRAFMVLMVPAHMTVKNEHLEDPASKYSLFFLLVGIIH